MSLIKGCDISSANGIVDFDWLKSNDFQFIGLESYVGNDYVDQNFSYNLSMAQERGFSIFAYNFLYPLPGSAGHANRNPKDQALLHFNNNKGLKVIAADLEWPSQNVWAQWSVDDNFIKEWTLSYLQEYEALSGVKPLLYTYPSFAQALQLDDRFAAYNLWLANYSNFNSVAPWSDWTMLQASGNGGVKLPNGAWIDVDYVKDMSLFNI